MQANTEKSMPLYADLHIHSRFSRATAKDLSPKTLDGWARLKGLDIIGTGDFTHPKWREELHENLVRDDKSGLYTLKGDPIYPSWFPAKHIPTKKPLFCLQTEISSIYKKNGRVRKIHTLIYVPSLDDADRFSDRLGKIGNIASDGRPILGLDAKDLFALLLDTVPNAVLIPAHIWTPWFSLFGSNSGFDRIEDCFEDLTDAIFALETGLSSDPPMNRYVSELDRFALVSNSDAHSGPKLAREANVFEGSPSFDNIFNALRASAQRKANQESLPCHFLGTIEFYPEEGKYHLDGHRACQISLNPIETREYNAICPVCKKPLTIGVLHRVMELCDRRSTPSLLREPSFTSIVPLQEMIAEMMGVSTSSKKCLDFYSLALANLGSELSILTSLPLDNMRQFSGELCEAVRRLREGKVFLEGGFDGEFGRVHLFNDEEIPDLQRRLGIASKGVKRSNRKTTSQSKESLVHLASFIQNAQGKRTQGKENKTELSFSLEQKSAITHGDGPALILAGPGSGKTHVLLGRIAYLCRQNDNPAILAITFTRKAAEEMQKRLALFPKEGTLVCDTLHGFSWHLLERTNANARILSDDVAFLLFSDANPSLSKNKAKTYWSHCQKLREQCALDTVPVLKACFSAYTQRKAQYKNIFDFIDILEWALRYLRSHPIHFDAVLVDEVQDWSPLQINLIHALVGEDGKGFFGIGDPDQAIYAFRGAVRDSKRILLERWPNLVLYSLQHSYRSSQAILSAAQSVLLKPQCGILKAAKQLPCEIHACYATNAETEAMWIAKAISNLVGQSSHTLLEEKKGQSVFQASLAPEDIAILVRFSFLMPPLAKALSKVGVPYSCPSAEAFWNDPVIKHFLSLLDPALDSQPPDLQISDSSNPVTLLPWLEAQEWAGPALEKTLAFRLLCRMWKRFSSWKAFFQALQWEKAEEQIRMHNKSVQLLTLHAAKGLEFRAVFLPALEEGILPASESLFLSKKPALDKEETEKPERGLTRRTHAQEEERHLLYVGITRASELLFLSSAAERTIFGQKRRLKPSPFMMSLEPYSKKIKIVEKTTRIPVQESLLSTSQTNE